MQEGPASTKESTTRSYEQQGAARRYCAKSGARQKNTELSEIKPGSKDLPTRTPRGGNKMYTGPLFLSVTSVFSF